jgi:tagaturonate reductase
MQKLARKYVEDSGRRTLKVVQFGGGNFLRAFTDWMVERMNRYCAYDGGVAIIKPTRSGNYDELIEQEGLFHVITCGFVRGKVIEDIELITCVDKIVQPYQRFDDFLDLALEPDLRIIVSNTTESGIVYQQEAAVDRPPQSFPGKLAVFLKARFDHFEGASDKGCILLPCELIEANGKTLKEIVLKHAREWQYPEDFIEWLQVSNLFCNTLVDRIVQGLPTPEKLREYQKKTGFIDQQMVVAEPYHLWVIEGPDWIEKEFPLQKAGIHAVITNDLSSWRLQKIRLLNGCHTAMVPLGLLSGVTTVGDFVGDPDLHSFLQGMITREIIPSIEGVDRLQLEAYAADVLDRYRNPFVEHKLSSIALNSIAKFKVRVLPSLTGYYLKTGEIPERLVLAFAALLRFYEGTWQGNALPVNDGKKIRDIIQSYWVRKRNGQIDWVAFSEAILADTGLWDSDLTAMRGLKARLASRLRQIDDGMLLQQIKQLGI